MSSPSTDVRFQHDEVAHRYLFGCAFSAVFFLFWFIWRLTNKGFDPFASWLLALMIISVMLGLSLSFLTLRVTGDEIQLRFWPGIVRKTYPIRDLVRCTIVRLPWYLRGSDGVAFTSKGIWYNFGQSEVAELVFRNEQIAHIGCSDLDGLMHAIDSPRIVNVR